jgi:hypothetical protein
VRTDERRCGRPHAVVGRARELPVQGPARQAATGLREHPVPVAAAVAALAAAWFAVRRLRG